MAAFSKANIKSIVRRALREPNARLYTDTEINAWIDEGARRTSILTLCNETSELTNVLREDEIVVPLTTNPRFIHIYSVVVRPSGTVSASDYGLQRARITAFGHGAGDGTAGAPRFWDYFGNNIVVWPVPSSSEALYKLYVHGFNMAYDYGDSGSETLPDEIQHFVSDYAMSMAYTKAGKHSQAAYYLKRFIDECAAIRNSIYETLDVVHGDDMTSIPQQVVQVK